MKRIKVTVDLETDTKEQMVEKLRLLIWEVQRMEVGKKPLGTWRSLSEMDRANLAVEYVRLRETANGSAQRALGDAHGWQSHTVIDCIARMRGQGYLMKNEPGMPPALGQKTLDLLAGRLADEYETPA